MTAGDRRLVREAVAAYFGGTENAEDAGIYYQGGPLSGLGLGTAYPYKIKKGAPDQYYTQGNDLGWGAVLSVALGQADIKRIAIGGQTGGWRARSYTVTCSLDVISYQAHLETAESGVDDLVDALIGLVYADRTLGTTDAVLYPETGRLITQAGELPEGITVGAADWEVEDDRGRGRGGLAITFTALTMVEA